MNGFWGRKRENGKTGQRKELDIVLLPACGGYVRCYVSWYPPLKGGSTERLSGLHAKQSHPLLRGTGGTALIDDTPKNGRPSKFNEPIKEKICELIRQGETQEGGAIRCGITDRTLRRWLAKGAKAEEGEFADFYCKFQIAIQDSEKSIT